jgi:site-specific DNA-cytosine methylase
MSRKEKEKDFFVQHIGTFKKLGLADARGTLFYEFARVVKEVNPPICIGENVRGLLSHDNGKTLQGMISILDEIVTISPSV